MMELIGLLMIYSWIHFAIVQHFRGYEHRTDYEKVLTWVAIVSMALFVVGTLSN